MNWSVLTGALVVDSDASHVAAYVDDWVMAGWSTDAGASCRGGGVG